MDNYDFNNQGENNIKPDMNSNPDEKRSSEPAGENSNANSDGNTSTNTVSNTEAGANQYQNPYGNNYGYSYQNTYGNTYGNSYNNSYGYGYQNPYGYGANNSPYGNTNQGNIKVKNKKNRTGKHFFRKAVPFIASMLVAVIVGGAAGGAYVNYIVEGNKPYIPSTSGQQDNSSNPVSYVQPSNVVAKVAAEVGPAVVGVETTVNASTGFFGQSQAQQQSGSGVIFDKNGYIITNEHVIDGGSKITVTLPGDKQTFPAKVIGYDTVSDIAVLKINAANLPVAKLGDSSKINVGDTAIAIGNPLGEEYAGSVTAGIISALDRTVSTNDGGEYSMSNKLIQTDAAINPGNSGGPLLNANGEVIGITSIKFADSSIEGMGFAIPINDVKTVVNQLMQSGYVSRPYLGISVETITPDLAAQYNYPVGVYVDSVALGTAAKAAGIRPADIILEIDGVKLTTSDQLISELMKHKVGDTVKLKIWRNGSTLTVSATLGENKGATN